MGVLSRLVLFSEVQGTVVKNGVPVAGAELSQEIVWSDNKNDIPAVHIQTNSKGQFSLPIVERSPGALRMIPHQAVILQKLLIHVDGVEYVGWRHTKNSYDENSELDGKPIRLVCELSSEPDFEGKHYGICRAE